MRIPRLLALFVGADFFQNKLREIEAAHALTRDRIHVAALTKARLMYPNSDLTQLSAIIAAAQDEILNPFEAAHHEKCQILRAAINACNDS